MSQLNREVIKYVIGCNVAMFGIIVRADTLGHRLIVIISRLTTYRGEFGEWPLPGLVGFLQEAIQQLQFITGYM